MQDNVKTLCLQEIALSDFSESITIGIDVGIKDFAVLSTGKN